MLTVWEGVAFAAGVALWLISALVPGQRLTWRTWLAGLAFGAPLMRWTRLLSAG